MKAIFFALGSRGDIEPLFSLGEAFREKNWEIIYVFPEQFRSLIPTENTQFHGFTPEFIDVLLTSDKSKVITGGQGSVVTRVKAMLSLIKKSIRVNKEVTALQKKIIDQVHPDFVFFNQKCIYPIVWGIKNSNKSIFVHPFPCFLHTVHSHSIIGFKGGGNYGKILNSLSYQLQCLIISLTTYFSTKKLGVNNTKVPSPLTIRKHLIQKIISIYTVSPTLFEQPRSWGNHIKTTGYVERNKTMNWHPSAAIKQFLESYKTDKILFITFGSMANPTPKENTEIILEVLKKYKIPTIINESWGGLIKPEHTPRHILFVKDIPYDWIFPKVYGVVHHGGSGTTHTAIKYGCASLIIPHFIDQYYWNKIISKKQLGPKGIPINKLNIKEFEPLIIDLYQNRNYKTNAELTAKKNQREFNIDELIKLIKFQTT